MSKLTITRRNGQSTRLEMLPGVFLNLRAAYISSDQVKFELTSHEGDSLVKRVNVGGTLEIGDGVMVHVVSIKFRAAKLCFEAPLNVKIVRTELLERAA